jgi:hypothetical protein
MAWLKAVASTSEMKITESQKVAAAAWRIRRYALQMGEVQGQGYIDTGGVGREVAAEEQRGAGDVHRVAEAVHRNAGKKIH